MKWFHFLILPLSVISEQMRGLSIFGLETDHRGFMCDWVKPVDYYIEQSSQLGFNFLRIPFSYQYIQEGNLDKLDHIVGLAGYYNMSVILDYHRVWDNTQQSTPFDYGVSEQQFSDVWINLLARYYNSKSVIGHNAYNEFVPSDTNYLLGYTRRLFERVEATYKDRYLHFTTGTQWSGNLRGVNLEDLPYKERIFYSVHKYSFSGTANEADWEASFGNVGIPVERLVVGEWGWVGDNPSQVEWAKRFIQYLKKKNITNTCYWALSQSGDTGNLYGNDCLTFHYDNYNLLKTLWT